MTDIDKEVETLKKLGSRLCLVMQHIKKNYYRDLSDSHFVIESLELFKNLK